jgi:hypothetical protein
LELSWQISGIVYYKFTAIFLVVGILLFELSWQIVGVVWLAKHYLSCPSEIPKKVTLGK